jgi:exodeoxyribonuclease VII large subunit
MVADRRCSTPTAAAESVAPAFDEVEGKISERAERLGKAMGKQLSGEAQRLDTLALLATNSVREGIRRRAVAVDAMGTRRCLSDPRGMLLDREAQLEQTGQRLHDAIPRTLQRRGELLSTDASRLSTAARRMLVPFHAEVTRSAATLDALSPLKVLGRGYAVARDANGHVVDSVGKVAAEDVVSILVSDGSIRTRVTGIERDGQTGESPREA